MPLSIHYCYYVDVLYSNILLTLQQNKVHSLAGDEYRSPVLESIKEWIQVLFQSNF